MYKSASKECRWKEKSSYRSKLPSMTLGNVVEVRCTTGEGGKMVKGGGVYTQRCDITGLWRQFVITFY